MWLISFLLHFSGECFVISIQATQNPTLSTASRVPTKGSSIPKTGYFWRWIKSQNRFNHTKTGEGEGEGVRVEFGGTISFMKKSYKWAEAAKSPTFP